MIVRYLPEAYEDLDAIWDYINGNAGERIAVRVTDRLVELASGLVLFPHRHEAIPLTPQRVPLNPIGSWETLASSAACRTGLT